MNWEPIVAGIAGMSLVPLFNFIINYVKAKADKKKEETQLLFEQYRKMIEQSDQNEKRCHERLLILEKRISEMEKELELLERKCELLEKSK